MKNGFVIDEYGSKKWYKNDLLHREDGPAIEYYNEDKSWYQEGNLHRLDGPAIEWAGRYKEWHYKDKYIECSSQKEFERLIKLKIFW